MRTRFLSCLGVGLLGLQLLACDTTDAEPMSETDADPAPADASGDDGGTFGDGADDGGDDDDGGPVDGDSSGGDGEPGDTFGDSGDSGPIGGGECDVFTQDCPDGEKCMPWADDGGNAWNATKCVEIAQNPAQVGDPCVVEGSGVSGVDNCGAGSMCYFVSAETNEGTCTPLCGGNPATPQCDDGAACAIYNDGILPLCLESCDPLVQTCSGSDRLCVASPANDGFVCILDALPNDAGVYGAPCDFANACDPGLFCAVASIVPNCTNPGGCCSEYCDLTAGSPDAECSGHAGGQACQPWWNGEPAAPGYEAVGYCGIPQ